MKIFFIKATGQIINAWAEGGEVSLDTLSPSFRERVAAGTHEFADAPAGVSSFDDLPDCDYDGSTHTLNALKKTDRLSKKNQHENRVLKLVSIKKADLQTAGAPDLDKIVDAVIDIGKVVRRMIKGD